MPMPEQIMVRDSMPSFAQQWLAAFSAAWDREHRFPAQALKELGGLGAMEMVVPEAYGGAGLDGMSLALAFEEIAIADGPSSTVVSAQSLRCLVIGRALRSA